MHRTALAVFDLSPLLELSGREAVIAVALSAVGFGSWWTRFEPFTADPLIFFPSALPGAKGVAAG
jgi:hypothetical protein